MLIAMIVIDIYLLIGVIFNTLIYTSTSESLHREFEVFPIDDKVVEFGILLCLVVTTIRWPIILIKAIKERN